MIEMETKQNTNDFAKGMTNIPSDNICPDDSVAAEWNMIFRNGEHCPIQAPANPFEGQVEERRIERQLMYIHNYNGLKRCIFYDTEDKHIYWARYDDIDSPADLIVSFEIKREEINAITSIGHTLIISLSTNGHKSLHYFLWKPELQNYKFIGTKLPSPNFDFLLHRNLKSSDEFYLKTQLDVNDNFNFNYVGGNYQTYTITPKTGKEEDMKSFLIGAYSKLKVEAAQKNKFTLPFFIRYAIKLFDGSYTNISIPILMLPSFTRNVAFSNNNNKLECIIYISTLLFKQTVDLTEWNDIIKGITIFVTKPIENNDTSVIEEENNIAPDGVSANEEPNESSHDGFYQFNSGRPASFHVTFIGYNCRTSFKSLTEEQMEMAVSSESVFYKLCDITLESMDGYTTIDKYMRPHDLENITTAEQLEHDDYYSNCDIFSDNMFMYNKRLHISNISRGFYSGASLFCPFNIDKTSIGVITDYETYVYIKTQDGERIVRNAFWTHDYLGIYFYYPDPRAYKVEIFYKSGSRTIRRHLFNLKQHTLLNGAYYIDYSSAINTSDTEVSSPTQNITPEKLQNEIWVSEVNNPFVFNASGVNTVGNGSIIGIISNTQALSQGQFGQFPLFCFTTDGVWTLQISSEGTYSSAHPISREICNNKDSITATDNLVFFSSEKGLMMINGADVSCVSSHLNGKTYVPLEQEVELYITGKIEPVSFVDFIKKCKIAYDYRDNLLWIVNPDYKHCFILSIESGAYAMTTLGGYPENVVNDYPDTLIEIDNGKSSAQYKTLSLISRPNINDDERRISSFIISRPMKIGDQNSLKTPTMIRYIGNNNRKAVIKLRLFASDDLMNWVRVNSLRGRGFKYYKYNIIFEDLLPTDTFSGVTERWQFRYQSKFR